MTTVIDTIIPTQTQKGTGAYIPTLDGPDLDLEKVINFRQEADHGVALTMSGEVNVPMRVCARLRGIFSV